MTRCGTRPRDRCHQPGVGLLHLHFFLGVCESRDTSLPKTTTLRISKNAVYTPHANHYKVPKQCSLLPLPACASTDCTLERWSRIFQTGQIFSRTWTWGRNGCSPATHPRRKRARECESHAGKILSLILQYQTYWRVGKVTKG